MTADISLPLVPELALFALERPGVDPRDRARHPSQSAAGEGQARLLRVAYVPDRASRACFGLTFASTEGASIFGGAYVQDGLAIFAKRLVLAAAALSVLASLTNRQSAFARRAAEYHFTLLFSLLGMMVLVSARELVLLFVAFELMSIPLYVLTGFLKREGTAPEAALKFFLVGTVSAAVIAYGMSFMYGVMGTTLLSAVPAAMAQGQPLMMLGMALVLAGLGFKIAAFPFHMWAPDTYEAGSTPFIAWLSVAPKAAGFVVIIRLYMEGAGSAALAWVPLISMLAGVTIVAGNLMAIPQRNVKRLLAYSGVAHIGYMLIGLAAMSSDRRRDGALLSGRLRLRQHGRVPGRRDRRAIGAVRRHRRLSRPRAAIAAARARDAAVPALARRHPVRRGLLGQAVCLPGRRGARAARSGVRRRCAHRRRALLLPARRAADVHRSAGHNGSVPVDLPLAAAITVCLAGVIGIGVYPGPWVAAAQRIAQTLF